MSTDQLRAAIEEYRAAHKDRPPETCWSQYSHWRERFHAARWALSHALYDRVKDDADALARLPTSMLRRVRFEAEIEECRRAREREMLPGTVEGPVVNDNYEALLDYERSLEEAADYGDDESYDGRFVGDEQAVANVLGVEVDSENGDVNS